MKQNYTDGPGAAMTGQPSAISGTNRTTIDAIFARPAGQDVRWADVMDLVGEIGTVEQEASEKYALKVGREVQHIRKPNTRHLTSPDVIELRHFLARAGWSPARSSEAPMHTGATGRTLLVVLRYHGTKIYDVGNVPGDPSQQLLRPVASLHILHQLEHEDAASKAGQDSSTLAVFHGSVASAVAEAARVIVIDTGSGHGHAAERLADYLREHHGDAHPRTVDRATSTLIDPTDLQLLDIARSIRPNEAGGDLLGPIADQ